MGIVIGDARRYWPGPRIPFLIDGTDFPPGTADRQAVEAAIAQWNMSGVVRLVARANDPDFVLFRRHANACQTVVGRSGGQQEILCAVGAGFGAGSVMHEIGHSLGLFHEHQRPDRDTFVSVDASVVNTVNYRIEPTALPVGNYDCGSIMHYPVIAGRITNLGPACAAMGQTTAPSAGDTAAVVSTRRLWVLQNRRIHRVNPADGNYQVVGGADWLPGSITDLADRLYVLSNSRIHRVNPANGGYDVIGPTDWLPGAITALADSLYVLSNKRIHRVNPADGNYEVIGPTDWLPGSITALVDRLYVLSNKRIHRVNPADGNYQVIGGADWLPGTITALADRLYVLSNNRIHRVNPADGNYEVIGPTDWLPGSITALTDRLYVLSNNRIHRVNPSDGNYEVVGPPEWVGPGAITAFA